MEAEGNPPPRPLTTALQRYHDDYKRNLQTASTRMEPTRAAAMTLRYHTYSLMLYGHKGNKQMAIVAITVEQMTHLVINTE